ncbi:MAG TPA: hypothetical protein VKU85_19930 [bacterium]|nr:hypothetical protein [bacterium]
MTPRAAAAATGSALVVGLVLRAVWPLADPPARLSWSHGVLTDPAAVVQAARTQFLHGHWEITRDLLFYPALNGITALVFAVFGDTRLALQGLAALLSVAAVAGFAAAAGRVAGPGARALTAWLLATSFWLGMFGRVPLVENLTCALLGLAAWLATGMRPAVAASMAVAAAAALFGKAHAAPFGAALVFFVGLRDRSARAPLPGLAAAAAVAVVWALGLFLPHREAMLDQLAQLDAHSAAGSPWLAPLRTIRTSWIFHRMPVLAAVGTLFVVETCLVASHRRRRLADGSALFAFAFLAFWFYSAILPYQAPRYYEPAVLAFLTGAALRIREWWSPGDRVAGDETGSGALAARMAVVFLVALGALESAIHWATAWDESTRARLAVPSAAAGAILDFLRPFGRNVLLALLLGAGVGVAWSRRAGAARPSGRRGLAIAAVLAATAVTATQWVAWAGWGRTATLEEARRSADAILPAEARLFGPFAPALALGTRREATLAFGAETVERLEASGATHVVLDPTSGDGLLRAWEDAHPGSVLALRAWGLAHTKVRRVRLASLGRADAPPPSPFERATADLAADRPEAALERLDALPPADVPDFRVLEARSRLAAGDRAGAREALERAVAMRPSVEELYRLGSLALADGDPETARRHWSRALRLDPWDGRLRTAVSGLTP